MPVLPEWLDAGLHPTCSVRRLLVTSAIALAVLITVLVSLRGHDARSATAEATPARAAAATGGQRPMLTTNALGQPVDSNGRPIGPPPAPAVIRHPDGDLPLTPPAIADPDLRDRYKAWWVAELGRRAALFMRLQPKPDFPSADQMEQLLVDYYDAAEPRGANETTEQARARSHRWRDLSDTLRDRLGAPLKTVASRGGDPQHGRPIPPPDGVLLGSDQPPPRAARAELEPPGSR